MATQDEYAKLNELLIAAHKAADEATEYAVAHDIPIGTTRYGLRLEAFDAERREFLPYGESLDERYGWQASWNDPEDRPQFDEDEEWLGSAVC
jgi:regulator of RNase E activity RraB